MVLEVGVKCSETSRWKVEGDGGEVGMKSSFRWTPSSREVGEEEAERSGVESLEESSRPAAGMVDLVS